MSTNYDIHYDDERFQQVESEKQNALTEVDNTYNGMINASDKYYQDQINASKDWADKQQQLQQEKTDFAIEQIEQQKEQAHKDYTKEQSASYVDWQKQSNQYGANAEQMASSGLTNTGYSESSQVGMYNTYQNRVATAREVYNRAVLNYDNAIKEAMLQNNSILAEIAYKSLYQQLEISLAGFQYKNQLVMNKLDTQLGVDNSYYSRYQDVLSQINTENSLAEQIRQFNVKLAEEQRQYNESLALKKANAGTQQELEIEKDDDSGNENQTDKKYTGVKVGSILSSQQASSLGLSRNDKILYDGKAYYVEKDDAYVDVTKFIGGNTTAPLSDYGMANSVLTSAYR